MTKILTPPDTLNQTASLLQKSERPLLIAHPRPDGDTIGSTLALRLALVQLGKRPTIACVHPMPDNLAYLPGAEHFVADVAKDADIDLVVTIDMSDLTRTGGIYRDTWRNRYRLLVIDHHETNEEFGDTNLVTPEAAATALIMIEVIEALGVPVKDEIATCLLVGILTDTRGLRTETTTPAVLRVVSRLIEAGGDYQGVMQRTLDAVSYRKMRAWGAALNRLQLSDAVAWTTFPLSQKQDLDISDHDDLDLGNLLSRVAEAKVIAAFIEMRDGSIKVSMRARPGYNVATVADALGGGGHRQAAGCTIAGPLEVAVTEVLSRLQEIVDSHDDRRPGR
ncbi:MAG: DHH family phosphoesterase [Anaerolineae bacterium]